MKENKPSVKTALGFLLEVSRILLLGSALLFSGCKFDSKLLASKIATSNINDSVSPSPSPSPTGIATSTTSTSSTTTTTKPSATTSTTTTSSTTTTTKASTTTSSTTTTTVVPNSGVLFQEDFEAPMSSAPHPVWSWLKPFDPVTNVFGMMYGTGDMFERSTTVANMGSYSLRLNLAGRNDLCNMCGQAGSILQQDSSFNGVNFFVNANSVDLSASPYLEPDAQRYVYNRSDRFSRWIPSAVSTQVSLGPGNAVPGLQNNRMDFASGIPDLNAMGGSGLFHAGDNVKVMLKCGVDGSVGGVPNRRDDCDLAINYLQNINPASDFPLGGSLFRRFYVYIPSATVVPDITLKLGYAHFYYAGQSGGVQVIIISTGRNQFESDGSFGTFFTGINVARDTWYYVEEQFQRESAVGASDGVYRLWITKAGAPVGNPIAQKSGLALQQLLGSGGGGMSIGGNWQHYTDSSGYVYYDDIAISTNRVGPAY